MEEDWKGFSPIASVGVIVVHGRARNSHKMKDSIQLLKGLWQERRARSERPIRGCHHLVEVALPLQVLERAESTGTTWASYYRQEYKTDDYVYTHNTLPFSRYS